MPPPPLEPLPSHLLRPEPRDLPPRRSRWARVDQYLRRFLCVAIALIIARSLMSPWIFRLWGVSRPSPYVSLSLEPARLQKTHVAASSVRLFLPLPPPHLNETSEVGAEWTSLEALLVQAMDAGQTFDSQARLDLAPDFRHARCLDLAHLHTQLQAVRDHADTLMPLLDHVIIRMDAVGDITTAALKRSEIWIAIEKSWPMFSMQLARAVTMRRQDPENAERMRLAQEWSDSLTRARDTMSAARPPFVELVEGYRACFNLLAGLSDKIQRVLNDSSSPPCNMAFIQSCQRRIVGAIQATMVDAPKQQVYEELFWSL
jgi:hypothetical protein